MHLHLPAPKLPLHRSLIFVSSVILRVAFWQFSYNILKNNPNNAILKSVTKLKYENNAVPQYFNEELANFLQTAPESCKLHL